MNSPECVAPVGDVCGEGVVWHEAHEAVYWTDINRFLIHRFTPANSCVRTWQFEEPVTSLALTDRDETLVVVLGSRVILWQPSSDTRSAPIFTLPGAPAVRLNDARVDPRGSLWMGSMGNNVKSDGSSCSAGGREGVLYRLDPDGRVSEWRREIGISNTLAWSPDRTRFYFGDTLANIVWEHDYDARTGAVSHLRPFFKKFDRGLPDGSCMDVEGYLWNCRYYGACVVRVAPDGRIARVIEMPVQNVTTCTFGGRDRKTLYITTARSEPGIFHRSEGGLFAMRTDVQGQPENRFRTGGNSLKRA